MRLSACARVLCRACQNALKYLLGFGDVSRYLGYNALQDHFPSMTLRPNPDCSSSWCRKQQKRYAELAAERALTATPAETVEEPAAPVHESNEHAERSRTRLRPTLASRPIERCFLARWGIELGGDDDDDDDLSSGQPPPAAPTAGEPLAEGLAFAHAGSDQGRAEVRPEEAAKEDEGADLSDLMAQLKGVQG